MARAEATKPLKHRAAKRPPLDPRVTRAGALLAGFGLVLSGLAAALDPTRFSFAYLWGFTFLWAVLVGSLFFVVLQHLTRSIWSVVIRRVAEAVAAHTWLLLLFCLPILAFAWRADSFHLFVGLSSIHVQHDAALQDKQPYLNPAFFTVRTIAFLLLWSLFARFYVKRSLSQDRNAGDSAGSLAMRRWSPVFMVLFAFSVTFASFDWLMSLNPHWFSTIFGVYVFAGMFTTGLAAIVLGVLYLRSTGRLDPQLVRSDHLYPLGGLLFGMSCFWAYIAFSQFMLIWYGQLPEEMVFFSMRFKGGWVILSVLLAVVRFGLPFFLLIGRRAKTNTRMLVGISVVVLLGEWLDLYWLIMPQLHRQTPVLSWPELGPPLLLVGLLLLLWARFVRKHSTLAVGDPLLSRSRHFHL